MPEARSRVVSSFTIIKGSLIEETYTAFQHWDFSRSRFENLRDMKGVNAVGAKSENWLRDVGKVLNRRFDPAGRDRPLVELAMGGCAPDVWRPLLLWHMSRDEFLVEDFLVNWLYARHAEGVYRLRAADVVPYLESLSTMKGVEWSGSWTDTTRSRVATGLLRIAADFGLLKGSGLKQFASYHMPDASFLYLLYSMREREADVSKIIRASDWRMFLMGASDVERELLRLHQYRKLHYQVAGTLAQLSLPHSSAAEYAKELVS